jgi:hypothetical protein
MYMKSKKVIVFLALALPALMFLMPACNTSSAPDETDQTNDTITAVQNDTLAGETTFTADTAGGESPAEQAAVKPKENLPSVLVYSFHTTRRCPSCIAIENVTGKTLETHFAKEVKQGRIKRQIINVEESANAAIAEKYQVFGSGLIVARIHNGKETKADLTGDGFRFARNKEERFVEILKTQITEFLK